MYREKSGFAFSDVLFPISISSSSSTSTSEIGNFTHELERIFVFISIDLESTRTEYSASYCDDKNKIIVELLRLIDEQMQHSW